MEKHPSDTHDMTRFDGSEFKLLSPDTPSQQPIRELRLGYIWRIVERALVDSDASGWKLFRFLSRQL